MPSSCGRGSIRRRKFTYFRKSTGKRVTVRASCVKSKGLRARGKRPKAILPPLKKGTLGKFGYTTKSSQKDRRTSLKRAARSLGKATVIRKLNAVGVLTKNTGPRVSQTVRADMRWWENKPDHVAITYCAS